MPSSSQPRSSSRSQRHRRSLARTATIGALGVMGAGVGAAVGGYMETRAFRLHEVTVPLLEEGTLPTDWDSLRVLHISDLHMLASQTKKQEWVAQLDELDPHLVINTGDNLGDYDAVPGVLSALGPLLTRPGAFVFGSNDYFAPRPVNPFVYVLKKKRKPSRNELPWRGMRAAFLEHGWHDANNRRVEFTIDPAQLGSFDSTSKLRLAITGVDDPHHDLDRYDDVAGRPNDYAHFSLGLTHSPEPRVLDRFAADGYQLVLAGHTHGGQLCLPNGKALVTNCGIDRNRAAGLSRWSERTWLHVSNGLGTSKYVPFRAFCLPSATLLHITERR